MDMGSFLKKLRPSGRRTHTGNFSELWEPRGWALNRVLGERQDVKESERLRKNYLEERRTEQP